MSQETDLIVQLKGKAGGAPPPPAVPLKEDGHAIPLARPAKAEYRRFLPHLQVEGKPLFVTFATYDRWVLPETARELVLAHCLHGHEVKFQLHGAVVMPDHVHLIFSPLPDQHGNIFGLAEIMNDIKGASAHSINKMLNRRGRVWQREYFDRVLRSDETIHSKVQYICENPVRHGLVTSGDDWPWIWREWVEGKDVAPPPPAVPLAHEILFYEKVRFNI